MKVITGTIAYNGFLRFKPLGYACRLFATLDPALRRVHLPSGREAILSDTVGFISDLPHQLVNAFKVTSWLALAPAMADSRLDVCLHVECCSVGCLFAW